MNKHPYTSTFFRSSLQKAIMPFTHTGVSSPAAIARPMVTVSSARRSRSSSISSSSSPLLFLALTAVVLFLASAPILRSVEAAPPPIKPARHTTAPKNLINAMDVVFSDRSPLPLQLQLEKQVGNIQKLAYLPIRYIPGSASAPPPVTAEGVRGELPNNNLDFYYINYRPLYLAGESTIDFWMLSSEGSGEPPETASLELRDEYGRVPLAVLVPEGTKVPQDLAKKNLPFLWKSWKVPKTLKSDFDFSDKFRVVLKTSATHAIKRQIAVPVPITADHAGVNKEEVQDKKTKKTKKEKRSSTPLDFLQVENNGEIESVRAQEPAANGFKNVLLVQDRQFKIKGLQAVPGGKPNPAKIIYNAHLTTAAPLPASNDPALDNAKPSVNPNNQFTDNDLSNNKNSGLTSAASRSLFSSQPSLSLLTWISTLLVLVLATTSSLC
ncbi:hypothetical protein BGZ83_009826 [Gryganskiella cystojenkinii]|nr:hypothetical protein BGZ83_009826 [Gryganskiella cystojenkinii]